MTEAVRPRRRVIGRVLRWTVGVLLLLPLLVVAGVFAGLNTELGRGEAAGLVGRLTGDKVRLTGLSGRFPDHLRLARVELHDAQGAWLTATDVALDWSPAALLQKQALVHRLSAATLAVPRLPAADPDARPAEAGGSAFRLPVRVTVEELALASAFVGKPVLGGADATVSVYGKADVSSLQSGSAAVAIQPVGEAGRYTLDASLNDEAVTATLDAAEPAHGLLSRIAGLPDLGPITLKATTRGPRSELDTTVDLVAGPLSAGVKGRVNLVGNRLSADVTARAPAMTPAPGVSWEAIELEARVAGPFTAPDASGHLRLVAVQLPGASLRSLDARLAGNAGQARVDAVIEALRIPGPKPELLAASPIRLGAEVRLDDPARPVRFTVEHPLLSAAGRATTAGAQTASVSLRLPDLAPIGAVAGLELGGSGMIELRSTQDGAATSIDADGVIALSKGPAPAPALLGSAARLALSARLAGSEISLSRLTLDGAAVTLAASGRSGAAGLDAKVKATLPRLDLVASSLAGSATLDAHVAGRPEDLGVNATLAGTVGGPGIPAAPLTLSAKLSGLPGRPTGRITGEGSLGGAPVQLALDAERTPDGTLHATISRADWRSLHAEGALALPDGATVPSGRVVVRMGRLEELRSVLDQPVAGSVTATAVLAPAMIQVEAEARNAAFAANRVGSAVLKASVGDPMGARTVDATLNASGIDAGGVAGSLRLEAKGPQTALGLRTTAEVTVAGTGASIAASALLNVPGSQLRLQSTEATIRNPAVPQPETIRLLAPATLTYSPAVSVDRLRVGLRTATLELAGRLSPTLDATATLRSPADIAGLLSPDYAADGTVAVDARLSGSPAQPGGTVRLSVAGLRLRAGPGRAAPPANLEATAQLSGSVARVNARLAAGSASFAVNGTAPLGAGALNLSATGALDLALLDPVLTAAGRRARGRVSLDAAVAGTLAAPRLSGSARLSDGEVQDFAQGFRLTALAGSARLDGDTVRLQSLTGRAGPGTLSASGTVGVLAPNLPLDLSLVLRNARPLASDQVTADVDADLTLRGAVGTGLAAGGSVTVRRAELRVPRTLPASVVTLNVRRPGDRVPARPAAASLPVALDLVIAAPNAVYLRGRGIDAEMQGTLRIRGTSTSPQVSGGLEMRRGAISVAGTTLTFTRGKVGFDGTGVSGKIDPTLDFLAESTAGNVTAQLAVTGYVSKPVIKLSSVPDLPQDEVLAYLIFKRSAKELGPFQIAEIAAAVAELTGVGGDGGLNPLESVRKGLGLDRLSVGAGSSVPGSSGSGSTPTVEAGRYVANGVYVGAKQGTTGSQTQATVQIDITKGLKVETDVGSGQGGNQVGLTYQFEY